MSADAGALFDAGTAALETGRLGEAVAFLAAAARIEPRAADIRRNLAIAERAAAAGRGDPAPSIPERPPFAVAPAEAWWLAAAILAVGAAAGAAAVVRPGIRRVRLLRAVAIAGLAAGLLLGTGLGARALDEERHPEAVVVVPHVEARRGPDEAPRAPVLLRAGERVRTGRERNEEIEVRLGGSAVGWVPRAALWRLVDTPGYTAAFRPR